MSKMKVVKDLKAFFLSKLERRTCRDTTTKCWNWTGSVGSHGYGQLKRAYEIYLTHRLSAYVYFDLDLSNGLFVLHKCDNKRCWNPEHLFTGTNQDNLQDAGRKGHLHGAMYNTNKTHCPCGREYDLIRLGHRRCSHCRDLYRRAYREKTGR